MYNVAQSGNYNSINCAVVDGVASITLNRPDRLNALSREMLLELRDSLQKAASDTSVKVVQLTGNGKAFCAGQNLLERDPRKLKSAPNLEVVQHELYHPIIESLTTIDKPVIVAVNGIAAGAGIGIALGGDITIAAKSARFLFSFVKVGLSVDTGCGWNLVKALGPARARALLMTGGEISSEDAERTGLIWKSVDDRTLSEQASQIARKLVSGPRVAIGSIKKAIAAASASANFSDYLRVEAALQAAAGFDADYHEGVLAFLEKRAPQFAK